MNIKTLFAAAIPVMMAFSALSPTAHAAKPSNKLLTPDNHTLIMIDHQHRWLSPRVRSTWRNYATM